MNTDILVFCGIILATPFIMYGLWKYISFVSNLMDRNTNWSCDLERMFFTSIVIGAPLIFIMFGIVLYAMVRDYGWCFLFVPISTAIAMYVICKFTKKLFD